jgi:hypothetical protein
VWSSILEALQEHLRDANCPFAAAREALLVLKEDGGLPCKARRRDSRQRTADPSD